jgi:uncharacterized protein (DUF58 family)
MPLFDSDFLKKLEYLSLISKRVFRGSLMAQRRTMQMGAGIEFADHREYTPGDDFRYLDWNLFARLDELLLKRFQEEEDLHVYFLLDASRSMAFGDPPKFDFARQVGAALAYIALADLDRIAVVAFANDILADFPLTRGKGRILALLKFLEELEPSGEDTNLERVITGFVHREQRRGLVVVLSDLYDVAGFERGLDLLRHRRYEPHLVQIYDRYEKEPADMLGDVEMWDVESGVSRKVTVTEKNLKQYRLLFDDFQESVQGYCNRHGLGCTRTSTEIPFDQLILRMMRQAGAVR